MAKFKNIKEVILYNEAGCELDRQEFSSEDEMDEIIKSWIIYPGDRIEVKERESEII